MPLNKNLKQSNGHYHSFLTKPVASRGLQLLFIALSVVCLASGAEAAEGAGVGIFQWRPFLAPFHAVVLHYPIGFLTLAFFLELYRMKRPGLEIQRITTGVIVLSLLSGFLAASLGIMRASEGGYEAKMLDLHRWFGLAIPLLTLITLALQVRSNRKAAKAPTLIWYRLSLVCTLVVLVIAGHYGGNLTHGSKYLVQNAPQFIKELLEEEPVQPTGTNTTSNSATDPGVIAFKQNVLPILETKCIRCHGPEKQKGGYRLDIKETAFKGGKSGEVAIQPKDPMKSHLVRLIMLPRGHDDVMPPEGKEPLTGEEVLQIVHWIQSGAPFPDSDPASVPPTPNATAPAGDPAAPVAPSASPQSKN